jgi:hypothetical protein
MHPYEVEIYVQERQRDILAATATLQGRQIRRASRPRWQVRLLWGLGRVLIRCGRRLCRASGIPPSAADSSPAADFRTA